MDGDDFGLEASQTEEAVELLLPSFATLISIVTLLHWSRFRSVLAAMRVGDPSCFMLRVPSTISEIDNRQSLLMNVGSIRRESNVFVLIMIMMSDNYRLRKYSVSLLEGSKTYQLTT